MKSKIIKNIILIYILIPCFLFLNDVSAASSSWTFDDNSVAGFGGNNSTLSTSDGYLIQTVTSEKSNTWLLSPLGLSIDTSEYKYLKVRVKNSTTQKGAFSFEATGTNKAAFENKWISLGDGISNDNQFHEYVVDLSSVSDWSGVVNRFRLRLTAWNCEGNVYIDYIKFEKEEPTEFTIVSFSSNTSLKTLTVYDGADYDDMVIEPLSDGSYKLPKGLYTYTAEATGSNYGKLHKNFYITDSDINSGNKTIQIDLPLYEYPGHWQVKTMFLPPEELTDKYFSDPTSSITLKTPMFNEGRRMNSFTNQTEMETYISNLKKTSSNMWVSSIGTSDNNLNIPIVIFSKGASNNVNWSSLEEAANALHSLGKPIVWVGAQVHGNEIASGEGALQLIYELTTAFGDSVLNNVSVVVLPRLNPKGAEYNRRTPNSSNDINRDRIKVELQETEAINKLYWLFVPEVAIDAHEYGAVPTVYNGKYSYASYDLLISASTNKNVPASISDRANSLYLSNVHNTLKSYGIRSTDYYDGGISGSVTEMSPLMTMNANANALYPSFSFLVESLIPGGGYNSTIHLKRRVKSQLITAKTIIEITSNNATEVKSIVDKERNEFLNKSCVYGDSDFIVLNQSYKEKVIDFDYIDLSSNQLVTTAINYRSYSDGEVTNSVSRPLAYILPKTNDMKIAVERLQKIGVEVKELKSNEIPKGLQKYVVKSSNVSTTLNQGVYTNSLDVDLVECDDVNFSNGAYYISLNQKMSNLIALALEPEYEGSFASYRIIDVGDLSVGESLPYYRYVGEKEKTTVSIDFNDKIYDGNPLTISVSGNPSYMIEWYKDNVKINTTPTDAGFYRGVVTVYEDDNYYGFVSEIIVSIEKATPKITVEYIGEELNSANLIINESVFEVCGIDGTLEITDFITKSNEVIVYYEFTPKDSDNYISINGSIKLSVLNEEISNDAGCAGNITATIVGLISIGAVMLFIKKKKENW